MGIPLHFRKAGNDDRHKHENTPDNICVFRMTPLVLQVKNISYTSSGEPPTFCLFNLQLNGGVANYHSCFLNITTDCPLYFTMHSFKIAITGFVLLYEMEWQKQESRVRHWNLLYTLHV